MLNAYLYFNAILYAVFGLWCTFVPTRTAQSVGFETLSRSGLSEYLVVYGGLQLGLAFFFAYCAHASHQRVGLVFGLALYIPIVTYRCATLVRQWPVTSTTLAIAGLEVGLLACAFVLFRFGSR